MVSLSTGISKLARKLTLYEAEACGVFIHGNNQISEEVNTHLTPSEFYTAAALGETRVEDFAMDHFDEAEQFHYVHSDALH